MNTAKRLRSAIIALACAAGLVLAGAPGGAYVAITSAPQAIALKDLGLREAGLAAAPYWRKADEIRIFASADKTNESPAARIWIHAGQTNRYWFLTGGAGSAEAYVIPKGAAVAVVTRASTNAIVWRSPLTETSP